MRRIHLHIGLHKTGTSAIQKFLSSNQSALLADGILYPTSARHEKDPHAQHLLAPAIAGQTNGVATVAWERVVAEIKSSSASQIIISSEGLCLNSAAEVAAVAGQLAGFEVRVVVYFRNALDLMLSRYKQQIKSQKTDEGAREFFSSRLDYFDYPGLVHRWMEAFGRDRVDVRCYELASGGVGLIQDFLLLTGVKMEVPAKKEFSNVSPDYRSTLLMLALNRWPSISRSWIGLRLRSHLIRMTRWGRGAGFVCSPFLPKHLVSEADLEWLRGQLRPFMNGFDSLVDEAAQTFFRV